MQTPRGDGLTSRGFWSPLRQGSANPVRRRDLRRRRPSDLLDFTGRPWPLASHESRPHVRGHWALGWHKEQGHVPNLFICTPATRSNSLSTPQHPLTSDIISGLLCNVPFDISNTFGTGEWQNCSLSFIKQIKYHLDAKYKSPERHISQMPASRLKLLSLFTASLLMRWPEACVWGRRTVISWPMFLDGDCDALIALITGHLAWGTKLLQFGKCKPALETNMEGSLNAKCSHLLRVLKRKFGGTHQNYQHWAGW